MQPGDLISGKYRLLRLLGSGGMGSVWAARNELTDRDFAIKFLLPDLARNKEALHRFFLEARACGQIKHPAVVEVYDMGQAEDGSPYLVMELLEGEGFDARLAREKQIAPVEAAAWIAFVARGLEEAHVRGLIHRDLKPGNIFFALDDRGDIMPKILDFGVSKATNVREEGSFVKTTTGAVLGSPAYMSPEQAQGETDVDGRSDVWALGVILYEAITGQAPFDAPNYNALMVAIMTKPHRPVLELAPECPADIASIIEFALAKDKNQRIGTARELADRLEPVLQSLTGLPLDAFQPKRTIISAPPPPIAKPQSTTQGPWSEEPRTLRARDRSTTATLVWAIAASVVGIALLGGTIAFIHSRPPMASVAGREAAALTTALAQLKEQIDRSTADRTAVLPAPTPAASGDAPHTTPAGSTRPGARSPKSGSVRTKRGSSHDPHGGVDSAGF